MSIALQHQQGEQADCEERRFYVYVHMDEAGKPLYVGKGNGIRFMQHMYRHEFAHHRQIRSVVQYVPNEAAALAMEQHLVEIIGMQNLINKVVPRLPSKHLHVMRSTFAHDMQRLTESMLDDELLGVDGEVRKIMRNASQAVWDFYHLLHNWKGVRAMERRGYRWNSADTKAYRAWGWIWHLRKAVRPVMKRMRGLDRWMCDILYCQRIREMRHEAAEFGFRVQAARKQLQARLQCLLDQADQMQPTEIQHRFAMLAQVSQAGQPMYGKQEPWFIVRACIDDELRRSFRHAILMAKRFGAGAVACELVDLFSLCVSNRQPLHQTTNLSYRGG